MLPVYHSRKANGNGVKQTDSGVSGVHNKRHHERYYVQFPVTLVLKNGVTCYGVSQDVSLSGFFVTMQQRILFEDDLTGTGTIQLGHERYTFQCRVVRQTQTGIGVAIVKDFAILGYAITTYIFNDLATQHLF
ncbi:MAG: PilZ domain-containing protein [Magnetococcus sp. YQC-5]